MHSLLTIIKYTAKEYVTKKSFIIVNIILILLIIAVCNIPNIMNAISPDKGNSNQKIHIVDNENLLGANQEMFDELKLDYDIKYFNNLSKEDIEVTLNTGAADSVIEIKQDNGVVSFDYLVEEKNGFSDYETTATIFSGIIKSLRANKLLVESNASQQLVSAVNLPVEFEIKGLKENTGNENFPVAMVSSYILFFAIYFFGYSVSTSVSSEKTSRVMETLVTSTTPTKIVVGKTIAMGLVGLGQMVFLIVAAILSYKAFIPSNFDFVSNLIGQLHFNVGDILICLVYFILGYTVYAFLSAVTGATVSKAEDVQAASTPISMVAMVSFFLEYFSSTMPTSIASKFASIFPFSAAFAMPGRILAGAATPGDIAISIIVLAITAVLLAFISIRVYSSAILHYGDRIKLKQLFKMYKEK